MTEVQLVRDVLLRDGTTLRLQAPTARDFDDLRAFYEGLSDESRYLRFHGFGRTDLAARHDAEADGVARVAFMGRHGDRVVAVAGYDVLREPGAAEVSFAVADDFRARGTATRLLEQLAEIAAARGIARFDAEVLSNNRPMLDVFARAGYALRRHGAFGEVTVTLDLTPTAQVRERIDERDHTAAVASLRPLLEPRSVAVLSAYRSSADLGAQAIGALMRGDFQGIVTPVRRGGGVVRSLPAVASPAQMTSAPDLAIVAPELLAEPGGGEAVVEAVAAGCKALVFLGADPRGDTVDGERWLEVVRRAGARMVGPYSLGVINTNPDVRVHATLARAEIVPGGLAIASQSGAVGIGLLSHAAARRLGISAFVSLGERVDVSTNDLLEFWEEDEGTAAVMLYVETFGNPERFVRIARRFSRRKPILAVKGHRARPAGGEARSHTVASLRGDAAVDALLLHGGVMRFRTGEELFNAAAFFEARRLPDGNRVGIVSNSAGVATLAQDACLTRGLVLGEVGRVVEDLRCAEDSVDGPRVAENPIVLAIGVSTAEYRAAAEALLHDPGVDALMVYYVDPGSNTAAGVLEAVEEIASRSSKPVVASVLAAGGRLPAVSAPRAPNFFFPEACASVLARGVERQRWLARPLGQVRELADVDPVAARSLAERLLEGGEGWLASTDSEALLTTHGLSLTPSRACTAVEEAVAAALEIGGPVALKADLPPPAVASDLDAVLLGLEGDEGVRAGWRELERRLDASGRGWGGAVVQPFVAAGADVLVGTVRDAEFGPLIALGLGGRQAGLAAGAAFRLLPETDVDADELIAASEGVATQLAGFRGQPPLDHDALRELILRFAALIRTVPEIIEADLNPVRVMAAGATVLDLRLRLGRVRQVERVKTW